MRIAVIGALLGGLACATTQGSQSKPADRVVATDDVSGVPVRTHTDPSASSAVIPATSDSVFDAVTSVFAILKVPVTFGDKATGEQGNKQFRMMRTFFNERVSTYVNCGDDPFAGPNADLGPVTVSLVTRLRASGGTSTELTTTVTATTQKPAANSGLIYCASTGYLESQIAKMVRSRFGQ